MPPVVVVRPLSGYANRLQAIVSGSLLADEIGADFRVCWEESHVAPVPAEVVLGPAWCAAHVRTLAEIVDEVGVDPTAVPAYLNVLERGEAITLAGLDRGEQFFMPQLREALASVHPRAIVLSAGGKFMLGGNASLTPAQDRQFRASRFNAYAELPLHPEVERGAAIARGNQPFVGLHLRYSDRSTQTPWPRAIAPSVENVASQTGTDSVFVASDTRAQRERWLGRLEDLGFLPWATEPGEFPRSDPRSALGALVDWRILTRAHAMVYFAASSFAEEASVAAGSFDRSVGLSASGMRTAWVRAGQYADAARTYPRRHGWWGSPTEGP